MSQIAETTWSYDESIARVRPMVVHWKAVTAALLEELHEARRHLSKQGARRDLGANASKLRTWNEYCVDVGLNRSTVNRWLKRFDPQTKRIQDTKPKQIAAPKEPEPLEYDITATHQIGESLRRRASFRLLVLRALLYAVSVIWRSIPRTTTVRLRLTDR